MAGRTTQEFPLSDGRLRLAADASPILFAELQVLAWYFLLPDMFRSEHTDTRIGSGSAR
jgi:hypothetical protein